MSNYVPRRTVSAPPVSQPQPNAPPRGPPGPGLNAQAAPFVPPQMHYHPHPHTHHHHHHHHHHQHHPPPYHHHHQYVQESPYGAYQAPPYYPQTHHPYGFPQPPPPSHQVPAYTPAVMAPAPKPKGKALPIMSPETPPMQHQQPPHLHQHAPQATLPPTVSQQPPQQQQPAQTQPAKRPAVTVKPKPKPAAPTTPPSAPQVGQLEPVDEEALPETEPQIAQPRPHKPEPLDKIDEEQEYLESPPASPPPSASPPPRPAAVTRPPAPLVAPPTQGTNPPQPATPQTPSSPPAKKTYSMDFLLSFQQERSEPPEKIKIFTEIYMPQENGGTPKQQQQQQQQQQRNLLQGNPRLGTKLPVVSMAKPLLKPGGFRESFGTEKRMPDTPPPQAPTNPFKKQPGEDEVSLIIRKITGILNRITPEKYNQLKNQMVELAIDTSNPEILTRLIAEIFERAVKHSAYCEAYADLCKDLASTASSNKKQEGDGVDKDQAPKEASFRRALLNKCQTEFEMPQNLPPEADAWTEEQRKEKLDALRKRNLGNIKFIGELFKRKMLTEKIMHEVIKRLLLGQPPAHSYIPMDEELEVLCKLWKTVGKLLDRPEASTWINHYFTRMKDLKDKDSMAPRIKFMLQDVLDLRQAAWNPRREETKAVTFQELEDTLQQNEQRKFEAMEIARKAKPAAKTIPREAAPKVPEKKSDSSWSTVPAGRRPVVAPKTGGMSSLSIASPSQQTFGPQRGRGTGGFAAAVAEPKSEANNFGPPADKRTGKEPAKGKAEPVPETGAEIFVQRKPKDKGREEPVSPAPAEAVPEPEEEVDWESKANSILDDFRSTDGDEELFACLSKFDQRGQTKIMVHLLVTVVSSLQRREEDRKLFARILKQLLEEQTPGQTTVHRDTVIEGFHEFLKLTDPAGDDNLAEDNPRLWQCFADVLVQCLRAHALSFQSLSEVLSDDFVKSDAVFPMLRDFFVALRILFEKEPDHRCLCFAGHFDILLRLLILSDDQKSPGRIETVIADLERENCIDVDPAMYLYSALFHGVSDDNILAWLKAHIPQQYAVSPIVSQKISATVVLHSAVKLHLLQNSEQNQGDRNREQFQTIRTYYDQCCKKTLVMYSQGPSLQEKSNNELQLLLEAQRFCALTKFPKGVLHNLFQVLYDLEIVQEETYHVWKEYPDGIPGKQTACKEVNTFLEFLAASTEDD